MEEQAERDIEKYGDIEKIETGRQRDREERAIQENTSPASGDDGISCGPVALRNATHRLRVHFLSLYQQTTTNQHIIHTINNTSVEAVAVAKASSHARPRATCSSVTVRPSVGLFAQPSADQSAGRRRSASRTAA